MAQYHYVVYYDTADEEWHTNHATTHALLPDGEVFDYAGSGEWSPLHDEDVMPYVTHIADLLGYDKIGLKN
jgi:hypothetical protein